MKQLHIERSAFLTMRKKAICVSTLILAVSATACGNKIPDMSSQQEELVVEYAADVLLKHSKNYDSKLVELSEVREAEAREAAMQQAIREYTRQEEQAEQEKAEMESSTDDVEVIDNTGEASVQNAASIEDFLQLDSVKFTYKGYETGSLYPEQGEELFFVMNATEGNQLLILKFQAENLSDAENALDIAQTQTRFRILVNGAQKNALTTMLLNDLAYYQGTLAPNDSQELVLICEVPEGEEIESLSLVLRGTDSTTEISLE